MNILSESLMKKIKQIRLLSATPAYANYSGGMSMGCSDCTGSCSDSCFGGCASKCEGAAMSRLEGLEGKRPILKYGDE